MKNADLPAMPISNELGDLNSLCVSESIGLTKREYFAAMAMQGLLAEGIAGSHKHLNQLVSNAVKCADELLKKLEDSE